MPKSMEMPMHGSASLPSYLIKRERSFLQSPTYGNLVTLLSIDGGGIRGIIPGTMLSFLESELQVQLSLFLLSSGFEFML
jgi:hypothetical protein